MERKDPRHKNSIPEAGSIHDYLREYSKAVQEGLGRIRPEPLEAALGLLKKSIVDKRRIYVGGNGGSAAISDHLVCDWVKGTATHGHDNLKVHSLSGSAALFSAIGNDFGYEHTLAFPLEAYGESGDVLVLISSSGNSANVIAAAEAAKKRNIKVIGLTGFEGGRLKEMADVSIHVALNNYGMVEDAHQSVMHTLAQVLLLQKQNKAT